MASSAWPKVSATTATPVSTTSRSSIAMRLSSMTSTKRTPAIFLIAGRLSIVFTRPRIVGARRTIDR